MLSFLACCLPVAMRHSLMSVSLSVVCTAAHLLRSLWYVL